MIDVLTWETAHLFGDAWISQHRLRYNIFVERQGWDIPSYNEMEYDRFDTPAAVYLLARDKSGLAGGITRLIPTTRPYMIKELWPELMPGTLPCSQLIWEGSRFGVNHALPKADRARISAEMVLGCLEYGISNNISQFIVLMPSFVISNVIGAGCDYEWLCPPRKMGRYKIAIASIKVNQGVLIKARQRFGIDYQVTSKQSLDQRAA